MNLMLLGMQGSGKGTISKLITEEFGLVPISIGELFRRSAAKGEELGLEASRYMNKGELVPDVLTIQILKNRLAEPDCKEGFILDGFPRNIKQAKALAKIAKIDAVIAIELPREECVKRLLARRVCSKCGEGYSTLLGAGDTCTKCGGKLVQRDDDKLDAINTRLEVYEKETTPLIDFYSDRLLKVSNDKSPSETYKPIKNFLAKVGKNK